MYTYALLTYSTMQWHDLPYIETRIVHPWTFSLMHVQCVWVIKELTAEHKSKKPKSSCLLNGNQWTLSDYVNSAFACNAYAS